MSESSGVEAAFDRSRERFESVVGFLHGSQAAGLTHSELEARLSVDARELIRMLYQDHLDLRTAREVRLPALTDAAGICRGAVERAHRRPLHTVFGAVTVDRLAYRHRGQANLYPADAALNLPIELHSHGLRELAAVESARGSFEDATSALRRATGVQIGKRQVEQLAGRAAVDFAAYYQRPTRTRADDGDVLVLSADGKGIVMRSDALRPATAKAAAKATGKLKTRLSKGEKRNRKRMAEVGAVYDVTPEVRNPTDIIGSDPNAGKPPAPTAKNKWLTASVVDDAATVIAQIFGEAQRRDPDHQRPWIALVDGAKHQIDRIQTEAKARQVQVHIVCDFVHVLE
ncbi:MAG: ISKra4 family transposase, partial [Dermatophilaceae bacterium]